MRKLIGGILLFIWGVGIIIHGAGKPRGNGAIAVGQLMGDIAAVCFAIVGISTAIAGGRELGEEPKHSREKSTRERDPRSRTRNYMEEDEERPPKRRRRDRDEEDDVPETRRARGRGRSGRSSNSNTKMLWIGGVIVGLLFVLLIVILASSGGKSKEKYDSDSTPAAERPRRPNFGNNNPPEQPLLSEFDQKLAGIKKGDFWASQWLSSQDPNKYPTRRAEVAKVLEESLKVGDCYFIDSAAPQLLKWGDKRNVPGIIAALDAPQAAPEQQGMAREALISLLCNLKDPQGLKGLMAWLPAHPDHLDHAIQALLAAQTQALETDQFETALEYQKLADAAAQKSQHNSTIAVVIQRGKDLTVMRAEYQKYKPAADRLKERPDDPAMNLIAGQYLCFVKGEWEKGLLHLSKSSEAQLKALSGLDLAAPDNPDLQVALADAWYELIAQQDDFTKKQIQRRASYWYEKAIDDLMGLTKERVAKRLEELSLAAESSNGPSGRIYEYARQAIRRNKIDAKTPAHGASFANKPFKSMAPEGGILVGLNLATSKFGTIDYISSLQPIYRTAAGETVGTTLGKALPAKFTTLKAKQGFAVGKLHVIDGGNLDHLSITFMKVQGSSLDPQNSYQSAIVGTELNKPIIQLDSKGQPVLGLHGKVSDGGGSVKIGLVIPDVEALQFKKKTPRK